MRRKASVRGGGQTAASDEWYGTSWSCACEYSNVGTERCYFCGSRAPRGLRAEVAESPGTEPEAAPSEA